MKSLTRIPIRRACNTITRKYATASTEASSSSSAAKFKPYPFSTKVQSHDLPAEFIPNSNVFLSKARIKNDFRPSALKDLRKGISLIPYLERTLPRPEAHTLLSTYFAKKGKGRLLPGSVLTVTLSQPPYTFSGVLIAIRRKGPDSSILLRNVVRKIGVEMRVFIASPTLLGIKVVQRAGGTKMNELAVRRKMGKNGRLVAVKGKPADSGSTALLDAETAKGWDLGTPGAVPTMRVARAVGIVKDRRKRRSNEEKEVKVDEKDSGMGKKMAGAKLYFLRDYPARMTAISAGITKRD